MAHVFGERTLATLERLLSLLSAFEVVVWMTDGWPLYESRLKGKLHVISKRYTQRIERHNLNLRQHLARLGRKSLSFSKSVELHDKVGFAPIFPDICYHLTHYKPAAADIPVASDNPAHYADAIRYNARTPLQGSLLPLTRLVWA